MTERADEKQQTALILRCLKMYSLRSEKVLNVDDDNDNTVIGGESLGLISDLLSDYINNGIYAKRHKKSTFNKGKPDWRKTLAKSTQYPSGNNLIYLDIYGTQSINTTATQVAQIQATVIRELDDKFAIFTHGGNGFFTDHAILPKHNLLTSQKIDVLERELRETYSNRDQWLLQALINYLREIKGRKSSEFVVAIKKFEGVWEHMLGEVLEGKIEIHKLIPIPSYKLETGETVGAPRKNQRMDIVLKDDVQNSYSIVDAKYYAANGVDNAPGWHDLVKQFFYAKAIKAIDGTAEVKNYFVFPKVNGPLVSAHMQERDTKRLLDDDYGIIYCAYADPKEVVTSYVERKKIIEINGFNQ